MNISVISFTPNGIRLSKRLAEAWENPHKNVDVEKLVLYKKCKAGSGDETGYPVRSVEQGVEEWTCKQMREGNALLFIGACGIAVRAIAPYLTDKLHDGPVLVMDEKGAYVIPILSGHFGGANEIAARIAGIMGAIPVITTATDLNHKFAVDLFAKKNSLTIANKEGIARVSSKVLSGEEVTVSIESGHLCGDVKPPAGVCMAPYPPTGPVDILVTAEKKKCDTAILLRPKEYVVGMGCKRGKDAGEIEDLILGSLTEACIGMDQLLALATIDRKKEEPGFLSFSRRHRVPFLTYTAEQLKGVEGKFQSSAFVLEKMGVDNVCERAAILACGPAGKIVFGKRARDGMTIAIAKREWSVTFDGE